MLGPERALVYGVVADRESLTFGESAGADGNDEEEEFAHNSSIGCFKQNIIKTGLGIIRPEYGAEQAVAREED